MVTRLSCLICFLVFASIASAQQKPAAKSAVPELKKYLTGSGLPYRIVNDSLAVIPYEGKNISAYNVIIQRVGDLYIVYTNLNEALPGKIDEGKYKYLLQQSDHYDIVKIGLSAEDNTVYLRADIYKSSTTAALLKRIIIQVANVTNIIGGDLKE